MATRLVSVNIGLPRDINWRGKTIHTGIWKSPVPGRVIVRKLNIDGDGQGDLGGHGGVNRAVMVYQLDSYDTGSANSAAVIFRTDNLAKTSPSMACLTLKCVSVTAIGSAQLYSRYHSRGLRVIGSVSAWTNRKWRPWWWRIIGRVFTFESWKKGKLEPVMKL